MLDSEASCETPNPAMEGDEGRREEEEASGSCGIEETTADLLKNTPSNIARLEDVIEHCKGRQKYLAQTRSPSDGSDVRWYFCKVPLPENVLAAGVPRSEVVGKSEYFRFGMRDSLAIEASFLQREEELLSSWWKEFAECSIGPKACVATTSRKRLIVKGSTSEVDISAELFAIEDERVGVPVKGGLYEVDLTRRHCFPVYWNGENRRVLRGHWFARKGGLDWLPLREDIAEQLEFAYHSQVWRRRTFQPSGLYAARVDIQGSTQGLHALFTGEDDTWEAWLNVDSSGISSAIGLGGNGIKVRRGYSTSQSPKPTQDELRQQKEEEMDDYCSQVPVRHLVFMVHGIGQRLEKSNLVDDVTNFRHITASLAEQHLTSYQRGAQRVLFIPCQWRRALKLSGEAAVEKITLDGVRGLRTMLGATVHDVLYYMSPIYCQDIIDSVSNQLNWLYSKFLKRNPGYDGKISLYGHSLGSVLSYDILCHQEHLSSPFPMDSVNTEPYECVERSSACSSTTNWVQKDLSEEEEEDIRTTDKVFHGDDASNLIAPPSVQEEESIGDSSVPISNTSPSESSSSSGSCVSIVHSNVQGSSSPEFINILYQDNVGSQDTTSVNCATSSSASESVGVFEAFKDPRSEEKGVEEEDINLLKKEVDSLKAKIAELELQIRRKSCTGTNENCSPNQPVVENISVENAGSCKSYTPYIKYTKLEFKVDTFFAVGSPLGVFLALRNIRIGMGKGKDYWEEENITEEMPACRQMFNIFHPFDPVAYRIEPLVCKEYLGTRPVIIPYHKGGKRLHIGFQEFSDDIANRSQAIQDNFSLLRAKVLTVCQLRDKDMLEDAAEDDQEEEERTYGSLMMQRLTGSDEGRVDHVLQDKTFEHPYISTIGAHTNYWRDFDTALFILKHLYRDIPEWPDSPGVSTAVTPKTDARATEWLQQREADEEELPLTLSDRILARNFSRRAKKIIMSASSRN